MRLPLLASLALAFLPLACLAQDNQVPALMAQAQRAYIGGDDETAKTLFSEVLQLDPTNTLAIQYLRKIRLRQPSGPSVRPQDQLGALTIAKFECKDAAFSAALDALKDQAAKQSVNVSFVSRLGAEQMQHPVSVSLSNIPFTEALRYLCSLNGATYKIERYAIVITPAGADAAVTPAAQ